MGAPHLNDIPKRPPKRPPKFSIAEEIHTNSQQTFTIHFSSHFPKTDTIATAFPNNSFPNLEFSTKQYLELIIRNDLPHTYNDLSHTYKNAHLSHLPTSPKSHKKSLSHTYKNTHLPHLPTSPKTHKKRFSRAISHNNHKKNTTCTISHNTKKPSLTSLPTMNTTPTTIAGTTPPTVVDNNNPPTIA
jgi:hypothetical protein